MAPTEGRVANPERRWDCRRGALTTRTECTECSGPPRHCSHKYDHMTVTTAAWRAAVARRSREREQ